MKKKRGSAADKARGVGSWKLSETHAPIFFLTGSIEHVEERNLVVDYALLAIRIFDSLTERKKVSPGRREVGQGGRIKREGRPAPPGGP